MGKLFVVMYHYTRDLKHSRYPEIKGLDVSLFREQIEFMKQQFNIVSMEQVIEAVERHADLPDKALLLTFDDGYVDNYTFAFLYRKFLKSSEIVYNRLEIKNDIAKERRGLRHDVVYEVFCFGLG